MKHTTDKGHNNNNHNSILAKSQQIKGKIGKKKQLCQHTMEINHIV